MQKGDKLGNFKSNNQRLGRLKVHAIYDKKKFCTDGGNPIKNLIYE